jgi:GxxExxY protein
MTDVRKVPSSIVSGAVVDAAIAIHRALGPGLLEYVYEACLAHDLRQRGMRVRTQVPMPLLYHGIRIESAYRADLLVADCLLVEVKSVTRLAPIHEAQLRSYLKLSGHAVGLLINFNIPMLRDGLRRIVNDY